MARRDRSHLRPAFEPVPRPGDVQRCSSGLVLEADEPLARWHGGTVALSAREESLLALLVRHPGRLVTHEELSHHAWDEPLVSREAVISTVKRVRARLRSIGVPDDSLVTVRGLGYRWDPRPPQRWDTLDATG
ncbi:MAG: helix-turn-helix domain-containing protein [Candidatus Nanopelagicales bacterium]